ncbi:MAG: stage II sporulation protein M [Ruminococcus sp.]|nr:stage II sporulation protein M [Ruminococcus sp.]
MQEISRISTDENKRFKTLRPIMLLILLGVFIGTLVYIFNCDALSGSLNELNTDYLSLRSNSTYMSVMLTSLFNSTIMLIILFLGGLCAVAFPVVLLVPIYKGMGLGCSVAQLYASMGQNGFIYALALILPSAVISCYALMIGAREAYRMSAQCFGAIFKSKIYTVSENARLYLVKFLILEAILSISATIDSICSLVYNIYT